MAQEEVNILRIEVDQASAAKELAAVRKSIAELTKERNELNKKIKEGNELTEEEIKDLGRVEKQLAEAKNGEREFTKVIQAQNNSLNQLRNSLAQLTRLRNQVDTSTDDGRKRFAALTSEIKIYSENIKRAEEAGGDFRRSVGNYEKALAGVRGGIGKAGTAIKGFSNGISNAGKAFNALPIFAVIAGLKTLAEILSTNQVIADSFAETFAGLGNAVGVIIERLTNSFFAIKQFISGEIDLDTATAELRKQFTGFGDAVKLAFEEGRDAKKAFNEIELETAELDVFREKQLGIIEEQKTIAADQARSNEERAKALRVAIALSNELGLRETELARKRLQATLLANKATENRREDTILELEAQRELERIERERIARNKELSTQLSGFLKQQNDLYIQQIADAEEASQKLTDLERKRTEAALREFELRQSIRDREFQAQQDALDKEIEEADKALILYNKAQDDRTNKEAQEAARRAAIRQQETQQAISASGQLFGTLAAQFDQASAAYKLFASAQATASYASQISNILSTNAAPSQPGNLATFGGAGAVASAIQIAAATAAYGSNLALINRAAGGGDFVTTKPTMLLVGDNPGGRERVTVEPLSGRGQTKIHPGSGMVAMAGGGTLTAGSGTGIMSASREASSQFAQATALQQALRNMPAPVVSVKDINTVQGRVTVKDNISRI
jgi:hypothetical protein